VGLRSVRPHDREGVGEDGILGTGLQQRAAGVDGGDQGRVRVGVVEVHQPGPGGGDLDAGRVGPERQQERHPDHPGGAAGQVVQERGQRLGGEHLGRHHADRAGVGHGRDQLGRGDPAHRRLLQR
jgi:hypothetical protein